MEASPAQIIEFFNGFKQSVIPLFQRPYEWKEREWNTLWQDLMERYEAEKDISHFMGAIVTMPAKSVPVGVSKYMVIDGQQRLTTIAILLCAIRDTLPDEAKPLKKRIQNHYLTNDGYEDWEYLKILPTQLLGDRKIFRTLVLGEGTDGSSMILAAYRYFSDLLTGKTNEGEPIDLRRVVEVVERRLTVVSINLGEADDPYLIFESLNFKGSPLTQADLVRNYFLMRFTVGEQQKAYDQLWMPMQQRLDTHLTEFMRQYLMKDGEEVVKAEIYPALKKRVADQESPVVAKELKALSDYSCHYVKLVRPDAEEDPDVRRFLIRLNRWDLTTAHPLMLRLYDAHDRGKLTTKEFCECLHTIESFAVRRAVCEVPTNQLKRIFLQLAKTFQEDGTVYWLPVQLASGSHGARWPKDDEFFIAWQSFRLYNPSRLDRCKLVLETLEELHGHKEPAEFDDATIEHVMPVTLSDSWKEGLGEKGVGDHALYLNTVGNLTLTGYNPDMGNMVFGKKKIVFAKSHFELNKYFAKEPKWGPEQIIDRAKALWEKAQVAWPRPAE